MKRKFVRLTALAVALILVGALFAVPAAAEEEPEFPAAAQEQESTEAETELEFTEQELELEVSAAEAGTFEAEFKKYRGEWAGRGALKMQLKGNTMTFEYRPVFFFDKSFHFTDAAKDIMVSDCAAAFQRWAGVYNIRGRELTIEVNVFPEITTSKWKSNVRFLPNASFLGFSLTTMVPGCLLWSPNRVSKIYFRAHDIYRMDDYVAQHEFGHVLGLFDAYGYKGHLEGHPIWGFLANWVDGLLPEAPVDRAPYNCIMRSGWRVSPAEAEMLLYAWSRSKLQLYTDSALTWLGAEVSKAFK